MASDTQNESLKATIYIDTQNLGNGTVADKTEVIQKALSKWPDGQPSVSRIRAYIDPGQENYWKGSLDSFTHRQEGAFAIGIPGLETIETPSVQRYSRDITKNALDITLVLDVLSDLILGLVDFAAVISNDSDFASLYFKLRELVANGQLKSRAQINGVPLLLFTHDRSGVSPEVRNLGENVIHVTTGALPRPMPEPGRRPAAVPSANRTSPVSYPAPKSDPESLQSTFSNEQLAGAVATGFGRNRWEGSDTYTFTYTAVFGVIRGRWPDSLEAIPGQQPTFSRWFYDDVWPVMEEYGATISDNGGSDPTSYIYNLPWESREKLRALNPVE